MRLSSLCGVFEAVAYILLAAPFSRAATFPIYERPRSYLTSLRKRTDIGAFGNGSTVVENSGDTVYSCNITLGGKEFEILIDTGSSDLWVIGDVPGTKNLSIAAQVTYAEGSAKGFINTADLNFDEFTVKDQAYINVVPSSDNPPVQGLIGLGPSALSHVRSLVKSQKGDPPLDRIFRQNMSTPNFITVLLSRESDAEPGGSLPQTGQLTVGSIIPDKKDITNQPKLPALTDEFGIQHWQTLLDANGIIGPDGQNITTTTSISNPKHGTKNQLHAILDTGFSFPQVTRDIADSIYGRVPGAEFITQNNTPGYWRIPCDYELNVSFVLGGVKYPIHPLDLTVPEKVDSSGNPTTCKSTFQQISPDVSNHNNFGAFDIILGMSFLRNTYTLIDFGDFVDGSNSSVANPYIQLLSTTDPTSSHTDFVNDRLGGVDTTGFQAALLSEADAKHSPEIKEANNSVDSSTDSTTDKIKKLFTKSIWFIVAVAAAGVLALLLFVYVLYACCCRRKSYVRNEAAFVPTMAGPGAYSRLRGSHYSQNKPLGGTGYTPAYGPYGDGGNGYTEPRYQYGGRDV